jgi:succinoglycan biosynthesis protein ExoV
MLRVKSLHWWTQIPNAGDQISPVIVQALLGRKPRRAERGDNGVLFGVGSILHQTSCYTNAVVWGSGCDPGRYGTPKRDATYLAVRGPMTRDLLELGSVPLGDPGFLMPRIFPCEPDPTGDIAIAIHHSTAKRRLRDALFDPYRSKYRIIDPRDGWRRFITDICRSRFVFCQAMHGAIFAQAYGVPWAWWRGLYGRFVGFKWADFFASISVEPKSFPLRRRRAAERWAARVQPQMPDLDDLVDALVSNVRIAEPDDEGGEARTETVPAEPIHIDHDAVKEFLSSDRPTAPTRRRH